MASTDNIKHSAKSKYGNYFPKQKVASAKKGPDWAKKCVDSAIDMTLYSEDKGMRMHRSEKAINYDLVNGIIDKSDMYKITNPWGVDGFDRDLVDYPLVRPRIHLLVGEESSRRFDWNVRVTNEDAVSEKEEQMKKTLFDTVSEIALQEAFDEGDARRRLASLEKYNKYNIQELHEKMASELLNYLWQYLRMKQVFSKGMEDVIVAAEEIYHVAGNAGELTFRRCNPLNIHTIRSGDSIYIEDSDIIIEDGYIPVGWAIDYYHDELKDSQIDEMESGYNNGDTPSKASTLRYQTAAPLTVTGSEFTPDTNKNTKKYNESYDDEGNIRRVIVTWRSMRKVGVLESYDEDGILNKEYVDENFKPNELLGQTVKWMWVTEWWTGIRLGRDIYLPSKPNEVQLRGMQNTSISRSGYVGTIYNIGSNKAYSLVSEMRPYQYLYDELMDRLKGALNKFHGPMVELDFAKMPDGWEAEKWMYYAQKFGYLIIDSFKEGNKGASQGKLAGAFNTTNKVLNPDLGNYIQHHISLLDFIERKVGMITGINDQRMGEISTREQVGSVERAVTQSSHMTQKYFNLHDNTKLRVLETVLEYAKVVYGKEKKKLQYILDDMSMNILNFDGWEFKNAEYGMFVTSTQNDQELMQAIKQLAHAAMQNDKATLSDILELYVSPSISDMRRKLEQAEETSMLNAQESQKQALEAQQQAAAAEQEGKQADRDLKERDSIRKAETQIEVALIGSDEGDGDENKNSLEREKLNLSQKTAESDNKLKKSQLEETKRSNKVNEGLKSKQITAQKNKPKTSK